MVEIDGNALVKEVGQRRGTSMDVSGKLLGKDEKGGNSMNLSIIH